MQIASAPIQCPRDKAFEALANHVKTCRPCGKLWAGVGQDRYEHCHRYKELAAKHQAAPCTCKE